MGINETSGIVVLLPFDVILWDEDTARVFKGIDTFVSREGLQTREVLTGGVMTDTARRNLSDMGFEIREKYLFEREIQRTRSGRI